MKVGLWLAFIAGLLVGAAFHTLVAALVITAIALLAVVLFWSAVS